MSKRTKGVTEFCRKAGISLTTYYRRKAAGQDLTAPPLTGTARARHALKRSPWAKHSAFKEQT